MATTETEPKKKPFSPRKEFCPTCYFESKPDALLEYRPGSFCYFCTGNPSHTFEDLDVLKADIMKMNAKKNPAPPPPPPTPAAAPKQDGMPISPIDHIRLQELLEQHITDSSVLCGAVWALKNNYLEAKTKLESIMLSSIPDSRTGGDVKIQIRIPEVYVIPLKDVAEANNLTLEQHMQAMIEDGLSNNWYF
jgi:hypothetical protein